MRYHYERLEKYSRIHGKTYICNHPVYDACTLFKIKDRGLAVIQQRFDQENKSTYWTSIDPWLNDILYNNPGFCSFFDKMAKPQVNGLYPTVTIRQMMWALKMKPLKKRKDGKPYLIERIFKKD